MGAHKRAARKAAAGGKKTRGQQRATFHVIADGLYELRVDARIVLDLLVTTEGELMTFVRIDGALFGEIPVAGQA
jgi:hypothetical protein